MFGRKTLQHISARDYFYHSALDFLFNFVTFVVGAEYCLQK